MSDQPDDQEYKLKLKEYNNYVKRLRETMSDQPDDEEYKLKLKEHNDYQTYLRPTAQRVPNRLSGCRHRQQYQRIQRQNYDSLGRIHSLGRPGGRDAFPRMGRKHV